VVVPVRDAGPVLADCLRALRAQDLSPERYELIVVDDGSRDESAAVARRFEVRVLERQPGGAGAARNTGARAARGTWLAFTDADCVPARSWLRVLLAETAGEAQVFGAAGRILGYASDSPAARFVDLTGGFDAERHLAHPIFPFAPSANLMYRRSAFDAVGGFDERYRSYEACDLHDRLRRKCTGQVMRFAPRAIVLHRHRSSWRAYWRQQRSYGSGLAQFYWHRRADLAWSPGRELGAWGQVFALGLRACLPGRNDAALVRRGVFVKTLAQRLGFATTYWSSTERSRF
jgi:glycosyltransferase involved in cell wall biosynthesis